MELYHNAGTPISAYFLRAGHTDLTCLSCCNIFFFQGKGEKTFFDTEQSYVHSSVSAEEGMCGSGLMYARPRAVCSAGGVCFLQYGSGVVAG